MDWDESLFYFPNLKGNNVGISLIVMHVPVYYYLIDRRETAPTDECSPEMTFVLTPSSNCIRIPRDGPGAQRSVPGDLSASLFGH